MPIINKLCRKIHLFFIISASVGATIGYCCLAVGCSLRARSKAPMQKVVQKWAACLLRLVRAKMVIENPYAVQLLHNKRYILMSNHSSLYDIPIILRAFPENRVRMIAKQELFRVPLWGHAMRCAGFLSIARNNAQQALKDLAAAGKSMEAGIIPWVAPEGTRSGTGELGPFKKGGFMLAIQTEAIIIPVSIQGANHILPAKSLTIATGKTVKVVIGKPIDAKNYKPLQRMALLKTVRQEIVRNLGY